ncbi:MAG: thiamine pyrophosphate-binding protein [Gammaproteobacteria bacterium]|nr:thiamine pyrophosphate-binding protein [Gammaproteobacteria bacterium]
MTTLAESRELKAGGGRTNTEGTLTFGDLIIEYLNHLGIRCVFGVPGGSIEPFFDAVARSERRGGLKMVVSRHESGAAFMADGYARETGTMGVCCSTTGPGATNLITGVASAYADNIPMLVITAQTPLPKFGKRALQDSSCAAIDVVGMLRHCTRFNTLVSHPDQLESKLISAIMAANNIPGGPVHISIPADLLNMWTPYGENFKPHTLGNNFSLTDQGGLKQLKEQIAEANRIVLFLGDGCRQGSEQIMAFAEQVNAPIITGPMGKRWVDETHPLYCGVFGFSGHERARRLVMSQNYDILIAIGAQLGELGTSGWESTLLNEKLIHIDNTIEHFTRSPMARLHVYGHLPTLFKNLIASVQQARNWGRKWNHNEVCETDASLLSDEALEKASSDAIPLKPQRLFSHLSAILPEEARIFVDAGNAWAWATHYMQRKDINGYYRIAMGFGSMTWAIGSSVGSQVASPQEPHVCITGDGSYLMSGQEITVALQLNLPLVMIVLNDTALGMVKHGQRLGGAEQIGYELPFISFANIAKAMGIEGIVLETPEQLMALDFNRLFQKQAPTLIDIQIDPEEIPPMGDRVKGLATSKDTDQEKAPN